jgi:hypothetical protein
LATCLATSTALAAIFGLLFADAIWQPRASYYLHFVLAATNPNLTGTVIETDAGARLVALG